MLLRGSARAGLKGGHNARGALCTVWQHHQGLQGTGHLDSQGLVQQPQAIHPQVSGQQHVQAIG